LSSLDDVKNGFAGSTPKLNTVGPDRFDHCFIYEEFVLKGEAGILPSRSRKVYVTLISH
jgi:hypothetical protein